MIYTVTFNPSLDYIVSVNDFKTGIVNRTTDEMILPGGKGINVSIVLKNLGYDNTALGFIAGFTGKYITDLLNNSGVKYDFIQVDEGMSRINVKIRSSKESEINGQGPVIKDVDISELYSKLDKLLSGDVLVLAGSIPDVMPSSIYMDICEYLADRGIMIVVDATKELLANVLRFHPFLIKPNNHELGEIFGVKLRTRKEVIPYARKLREMGAVNVLVSMAGEGAVLVDGNDIVHESDAPKGIVRNSVGAGDSMVAGFIAGYIATENYDEAFISGVYTGSASAFSDYLATKKDVDKLRGMM